MDKTYIVRVMFNSLSAGVIKMMDISNNGLTFYLNAIHVPSLNNEVSNKVGASIEYLSLLLTPKLTINHKHPEHGYFHFCGLTPTDGADHVHLGFSDSTNPEKLETMTVNLLGIFMEQFKKAYLSAKATGGTILLTPEDADYCMKTFKAMSEKGFPTTNVFQKQAIESVFAGNQTYFISHSNTTQCTYYPLDLPIPEPMWDSKSTRTANRT